MGWISDRLSTIGAAIGDRAYRLPLAVKGGLAGLAALFIYTEGREMTFANQVLSGLVVGLGLLVWIFLDHATRLQKRLEPTVDIEFRPEDPFVQMLTKTYNVPGNPPSLWLRVGISTTKVDGQISDCVVEVVDIEFSNDGTAYKRLPSSCPQQLRWANDLQADGFGPRNIGAAAMKLVDVVSTDREHKEPMLKRVANYIVDERTMERPGRYRVTLAATPKIGRGIKKRFIIHWDGKWDKARMEMEAS